MPQHQDLKLLRPLRTTKQNQQLEQTANDPVSEGQALKQTSSTHLPTLPARTIPSYSSLSVRARPRRSGASFWDPQAVEPALELGLVDAERPDRLADASAGSCPSQIRRYTVGLETFSRRATWATESRFDSRGSRISRCYLKDADDMALPYAPMRCRTASPRSVLGRRRLISSEGGTPPSPPSLDKVSVRVGRLPHVLAVRVTFLRFQILGRDPRCDSRSLPFSVTLTTDEVVHGPRCIGTCG